jgi:hypothetical protein
VKVQLRSRWRAPLAALVALMTAVAAAPAQASAPGVGWTDPSVAGADAQSEQLRAGLALDPITFAHALSPLEQVTLVNALGAFDPRSAADISWFFRAATRTLGGDRAMPIVTFYNPLADFAVVTTWRRIDAHWWLTSAVRLSGPTLRGAADQPWWAQTGRPYVQALRQQAGKTVRAAAMLTSDRLGALPEATFLAFGAHLFQGERGLATWASSPSSKAASDKVRAALAAAAPDQLGLTHDKAPSADQLGALGDQVRRSLVDVAAYRRADGVTLAMASPLRPGVLFFVDFNSADAPVPLDVTELDLEATAKPGAPA